MNMIKLKNIKKSFSNAFKPVLDDINLTINSNDFCVVIGANGSGKSTLLKVINGTYPQDSGSVELEGAVAQVEQDVNQGCIPELTLLENIALSSMKKPKFAFYKRYAPNIVDKIKSLNISLEGYLNQPLKALSGGQRQTIATLMAITSGCNILLLDEHTSALDPKMQLMLMEYTAKQIESLKLTAIMITHKMDDAIKYGNRLIMLHQGKVVLDVAGKAKNSLKVADLLKLFHNYEDEILLHEDNL